MRIHDRDPLELRVIEIGATKLQLYDGRIIAIGAGRWGELTSPWFLTDGACDPFWHKIVGRRPGRGGLRQGQEAIVYAIRARASCPAVERFLVEEGHAITVALHYNAQVWAETTMNKLFDSELLLGTPRDVRELLSFGVFVVPNAGFCLPSPTNPDRRPHAQDRLAINDGRVDLSLVGFLVGMGEVIDMEDRYKELFSATAGSTKAQP